MIEQKSGIKSHRSFEEMMELIKKYPIKPMNIQFHPQDLWECDES